MTTNNAFEEVTYISNSEGQPQGRSGHSMVADDGNIYVFGGYNPKCKIGNGEETACTLVELWKFNIATRKWRNLSTPGVPDTCASSCMILRGKKLFIYGGTGFPFGKMMSNNVKVCDISSSTENGKACYWYLLETNPNVYTCTDLGDNMPPRAYGQSLIFYDNCIYTFGGAVGFYDEAVNDLHRLNCRTLIWERLQPAGKTPLGRYKHETVVFNGRFYVFGGGRLRNTEGLNTIHAYEVAMNKWEEVATIPDSTYGHPCARCSFGLARIGEDVYICGGRLYSDEIPSLPISDMWRFSLVTFQWQKIRVNIPDKMFFHTVTISPSGHLYLYGGVTESGARSPRMFRWRIPSMVPKLMELAWEIVSRNAVELDTIPRDVLETQHGIPRQYIDRIS